MGVKSKHNVCSAIACILRLRCILIQIDTLLPRTCPTSAGTSAPSTAASRSKDSPNRNLLSCNTISLTDREEGAGERTNFRKEFNNTFTSLSTGLEE